MSPRIMGLLIIAAQIALYVMWKVTAEQEEKFGVFACVAGFTVVMAVAFVNLWVFMKALLMITGWE